MKLSPLLMPKDPICRYGNPEILVIAKQFYGGVSRRLDDATRRKLLSHPEETKNYNAKN